MLLRGVAAPRRRGPVASRPRRGIVGPVKTRLAVLLVLVAAVAGLLFVAARRLEPAAGPGVSITQSVPVGQASLTLGVIGDFGYANANEKSVASLVAGWAPDAVVATGDDYYSQAGGSGTARYDRSVGADYCAFLHGAAPGPACQSGGAADQNRFWSVPGNHDYTDAGIGSYTGYFPYPGNERFFSVRIGTVEVFLLDSDVVLRDSGEMAAQRAWLEGAARASTARWKIAVFHQPPYSSGSKHGSATDMRWPFASWGIQLVLNGHEHLYERAAADGVTYVTDGLGGAPRYVFGAPIAESRARYADGFGALRLVVTDASISGAFVSADGVTRDAFTLTR